MFVNLESKLNKEKMMIVIITYLIGYILVFISEYRDTTIPWVNRDYIFLSTISLLPASGAMV